MDLFDRILELSRCGWFCSQILAILALETAGEEDEGFVKAMGGLNGGIGFSGSVCGCLTGGVCVISYFTGKASDTEREHQEHKSAVNEFVNWFNDEMLLEYGGCDCEDITKGNPAKRVELCPDIIAKTYEKCMEILSERGII